MKHLLGTCALWVLLLFLALEINNAAYNFMYFPIIDPATSKVEYGSPIPDLLLLSVNFLTFATAGAIMAWWMHGKILSIAVAMAIGSVGLALEIATSFPWFQFMPGHPTSYDHIVAFVGAVTPPTAGALGAYFFAKAMQPNQPMKRTNLPVTFLACARKSPVTVRRLSQR